MEQQQIDFYVNQTKDRFLIKRLFQGTLESTLRCEECGNTSPNTESFLDISLPLAAASATCNTKSPSATSPAANAEPLTRNEFCRRLSKSPAEEPTLTKNQIKRQERAAAKRDKQAKKAKKSGKAMWKAVGATPDAAAADTKDDVDDDDGDGDTAEAQATENKSTSETDLSDVSNESGDNGELDL